MATIAPNWDSKCKFWQKCSNWPLNLIQKMTKMIANMVPKMFQIYLQMYFLLIQIFKNVEKLEHSPKILSKRPWKVQTDPQNEYWEKYILKMSKNAKKRNSPEKLPKWTVNVQSDNSCVIRKNAVLQNVWKFRKYSENYMKLTKIAKMTPK